MFSEFKEDHQKNVLGDAVLKNILKKDKTFLSPIREKRETISNKHAIEVLKKKQIE